MISTLFSSPLAFFLSAFGIIIALTVHEYAHAYVADKLGDPTARADGRLTLNPLAHLDPIGTLLLFILGFGWGKPVHVDPYNLASPRRDSALISLAGPVSNLILATAISLVIKILVPPYYLPLFYPVIVINISLAIFNLVPVYPLDGEKILAGFLPRDLAYEYELIMHRYGTLILIFLLLPTFGFAPISAIITPLIHTLTNLLL